MSNVDILEKLRKAPDAIKIWEAFQHELIAEKAKREEYYNLVHEDVSAEFINGEIVFHFPVKSQHWNASVNLIGLLQPFIKRNKLGKLGVEKVMIRLTRNDYEPDIVFFKKEKGSKIIKDQMLFPAPDLIVEILSPSTEKIDREIKFQDYAAHGVEEYWIVDADAESIEQYLLEDGNYKMQVKLTKEGLLHSKIIPGFTLDVAEIFNQESIPYISSSNLS
jgi:Uma2 family endonuclease